MSVTLNLIQPNQVTIQKATPIEVTLQNTLANQVNVVQQDNIAVTLENKKPIAVTVSSQVSSGGGSWGSITGTITDQTDLINYLNNLDLNGEKVVEALNNLKDGVKLDTYLRSESFESNSITMKGDGMRYTLPAMPEGTDYGYFMFTDTEGILRWKAFPLGFLNNNIDVDVNGGTF